MSIIYHILKDEAAIRLIPHDLISEIVIQNTIKYHEIADSQLIPIIPNTRK